MRYLILRRSLLAAALLALLLPALPAGAATDKELARQRGSVSYRAGGVEHGVSGTQVLPDNANALTGRASSALLTLPDSSVVTLGENTDVQVGAFNTPQSGNPNVISVNHGAMKFAIRHPQGAKSNYTFSTPTSQIAVRGTDGYVIVGPQGDQVVCTQCEPGDVTVRIVKTGIVTALVTGQILTVLNSGAAATGAVSSVSTFNSPAVNQFSNGVNPFGNAASSVDVTGSASGATAGVAGTAAGVSGVAVAGGAAATGVAVSAISTATTPAATVALTVTPGSFNFNGIGLTQSFTASTSISSAVSANNAVATVVSFTGNTFTVRSVAAGTTSITVSAGGSTIMVTITVTGAVVTPTRIHK